ncbi:maltase-glucoamylase, intestinal [Folsomia candida]|uniref:maltase-glucoamylase, intestinal n=1 Tax=Folsomia candida TaxID=158441 RepID=UPI000B8F48E4|nr:maltase-glucoamylase, intestinal [Folsomia candida]
MKLKRVAVTVILVVMGTTTVLSQECLSDSLRINCYLWEGATQELCEAKGCTWCPSSMDELAPSCYLPPNYGYNIDGPISEIPEGGYRINLKRSPASNISYVGADSEEISTFFYFDSDERLRIKITDNTDRFEVPLEIKPPANPGGENPQYRIEFTNNPVFSFKVIRVSSGAAVFDTSLGGLTFANQFIQIVNKVPSTNGYGIGENEQLSYRHDFSKWQVFPIYTKDDAPLGNKNVYGAHPTYTMVEPDGSTHTILFLNSNAQEFLLTPAPSYTYRTTGGLLDIYIFMGPTPEEAVGQYHQAVGPQPIPAYWSLGFNLCRWNYNSIGNMNATIERTREAGIPQDVQFGDLDIMFDWLTFTYDSNATYNNFSGLPEFIRELKTRGIHFIQSVNAQISSEERRLPWYEPLRLGHEMDVWVKRPNGTPSTGTLWPGGEHEGWDKPAGPGFGGPVHFTDFSRPSAIEWWRIICAQYRDVLDWDGLWLDMNEPASWVSGDVVGCADNLINHPPYTPGITNNISDLTICPDHVQDYGILYNTHSLYGWSQARGSFEAIKPLFGTNRTFQLSRSTFPGSGQWAAHWLGDNFSTWGNLASSLIGIMGFNLFGTPQSGVDICGFYGRPSEELCTRWLQVGAFYPYSRNHNVRSTSEFDQDPASWSEASRNSTREALMIRYTILPYMYNLFYIHRVRGGTVMRALWAEFPGDQVALGVDTQFLIGPAFLVSPVLTEGATEVEAYFPEGSRWFAYRNGAEIEEAGSVILTAPFGVINLHVRGGYILPTQEPALNTMLSRQNAFGLIVALDGSYAARGEMYWDDGVTHEVQDEGVYFRSTLLYIDGNLTQTVVNDAYQGISGLEMDSIRLFGAPSIISTILLNGEEHTDFEIHLPGNELRVHNLNIPVNSNYMITFLP